MVVIVLGQLPIATSANLLTLYVAQVPAGLAAAVAVPALVVL